MKLAMKVTGNNEGLYSPGAYVELRLQMSTGDFHSHKATLIEVENTTVLIELDDLIQDDSVCLACGRVS